jgi:AraC family transcriptional regulator of adaptative response / DNA-3-methyladenine glycosylase II
MSDTPASTPTEDDARYLALKARDARFDGRFFTAVTSTGIYCRPVCRVRVPRPENCRFYVLAAQAEAAGFRPCLRCRPELAPFMSPGVESMTGAITPWSMQDAASILARQAAHMLDAPHSVGEGAQSIARVAARLGISERHLRRIFESQWGVSPLQYWQTRRLLTAKQLLTDTALPVAQIALLAGFTSVRRFNDAFVQHYQLQPLRLRKKASSTVGAQNSPGIQLKAAYRPPYDVQTMLEFFARRQLSGIETVDLAQRTLVRTLTLRNGPCAVSGWLRARFDPSRYVVELDFSESLVSVLPEVFVRMRALLDLDADPETINATIGADFPDTDGLRVPGTLDGFELGVRAILGQQITVAAARTLGNRLVERFGAVIQTPFAGVNRLFPTPHILASTSADALGALGITRQRQRAIQALAQVVDSGGLVLRPDVDISGTLEALLDLPGVGPWTAHYIAMRALRWPDAFPCGDVALHKALGVQNAKNPSQMAEQASERWRPWRSYAVIRAWNSL